MKLLLPTYKINITSYNIKHTTEVLREPREIGVKDNPQGKASLRKELRHILKGLSWIGLGKERVLGREDVAGCGIESTCGITNLFE